MNTGKVAKERKLKGIFQRSIQFLSSNSFRPYLQKQEVFHF
jgi:hypothetical protein